MTLDARFKNSLSQRDDKAHNLLRSKMVRGVGCIEALELFADTITVLGQRDP